MTQKPESKITAKVLKHFNLLPNSFHIKIWEGKYQRRGISDIIGLQDGLFIATEVKCHSGHGSLNLMSKILTGLQYNFLATVHKSGGLAQIALHINGKKGFFLIPFPEIQDFTKIEYFYIKKYRFIPF